MKELQIEHSLKEENIVFYDVTKEPFRVYGVEKTEFPAHYWRLPAAVAEATNDGVARLAKESAGIRVRFSTDSEFVALHAIYSHLYMMPHMPLSGSSGFDLYEVLADGSSHFLYNYHPSSVASVPLDDVFHFRSRKMRSLQIDFPLYCGVASLALGFEDNAHLLPGTPYRDLLPFIIYGSSITQGGVASRPGNCHPAIVSRRLNLDYRNLGFSGSARGEAAIRDYIASLDCSVFVLDYDHNAPNAEYLQPTHADMIRAFREKHPTTPIVLLSRPDFRFSGYVRDEVEDRRCAIMENYIAARKAGDKNIWLIDGASLFLGEDRDECTVDRTHPNDLGFFRMADPLTALLREILF